MASDANPDVKTLLEAFQMSLSACLEHAPAPLLRAQMAGRLTAHATSPFLSAWLQRQREELAVAVAAPGMPVGLLPKRATLGQAGGLQRMILRGHTAGISCILLSPAGVDVITGETCLSARHTICPCVSIAKAADLCVSCQMCTRHASNGRGICAC